MASDSFDPYQQWLSIDVREQPIDHYRLLGLSRFEGNAESIIRAADERMKKVRSFQTGPRAAYTQPILNELAAAKLCLLDSVSKAAYDHTLEVRMVSQLDATDDPAANQSLSPAAPFVPQAPPVQSAAPRRTPVAAPPVTEQAPDSPSSQTEAELETEQPEPRRWLPVALVAGALLVIAVGLIIRELQRRGGDVSQRNGPPTDVVPPATADQAPLIEKSGGVVILQEGDGAVNFPLSVATLDGESIQLFRSGDQSLITNWVDLEQSISWQFRLTKPGIYRVEITYAADPAAADPAAGDSQIALLVDDEQRLEMTLRSSDAPDQFVTDFDFIAIPRGGVHTLKIQALVMKGPSLFLLKSVRLLPKQTG